MNVPVSSLEAIITACPVCGSNQVSSAVELLIQDEPRIEMHQCNHCYAVSANQMPTDNFIAELYKPTKYKSSLVNEGKLSERCAHRIISGTKFTQKQVRILDYGGSNGNLSRELIKALKNKGIDAKSTIVDLYPNTPEDQLTFITPQQFFDSTTSYDLVVASAVLEHLKSPDKVVRKILSSLASGGYFYARTPYEVPLAKRIPGYNIKWPRHYHDFGPNYWNHFLETYGTSGNMIFSRTSLVETTFRQSFAKTLAAYTLKAPSLLETITKGTRKSSWWPFVGGWEFQFQKN